MMTMKATETVFRNLTAKSRMDTTCGTDCAWERLDGWNWAELLARRSQFAEYCAWDKLGTYA